MSALPMNVGNLYPAYVRRQAYICLRLLSDSPIVRGQSFSPDPLLLWQEGGG